MSLIDDIAGPEGDLLGLHRLLGGGGGNTGQGRCEVRRALVLRLQSSHAIHETLTKLRSAGYLGVVMMGETRLFEALGRHPSSQLPAPLPIVPNLQGFMRDAVEHGMLGAGLRRAWRVGPLALAGLGLRGITRVPALARHDFPAMLQSFVELELADFTRYNPPVVFLQAQMTDLALAMRNPRLLEAFFKAVRGRTGAVAGLATQNFGPLVAALKSWGMETAAVIAPWTHNGATMRPDQETCLHAAKASDFPIWADMMGRPAPPSPEDRAAMQRSGLAGAVREDLALWYQS